ncbi:MAG: RNA polymerase sigma-70 factor (ECF subfamily) [Verrucomicrobiales bacterium]|jgi:RNA polymerase sigma-70 factor (ECF subfamily)
MTISNEIESQLIAKAQAGDQNAMQSLLLPYEQPVFRFLTQRLGNPHDAADVNQDTFIKVLRSLTKYEDRGLFRAWLYQIARNESINFMKRRNRFSTATVDDDEADRIAQEPDPGPGADEQLLVAEERVQMRDCVGDLPDSEREVVQLRLDQDITFREIADITDAPLNTVLGRMRNATRRLRGCMETHGFTSAYA